MNNVTNSDSLRARMYANWLRIRRTVQGYFFLVFLVGILFMAVFFNRIFNFVRPGEAGVIWKMFGGGTQLNAVYMEGLQLTWPWDKLYIYNVRVQQIPHEFDALSKNGLPIHFEISIRYQPVKETLPVLHQDIGPDYVEKVVKPEVQAHVRKIVANYLPDEIYTSEGYLLPVIRQGAMAAMNERNISLDDLLIKRMSLPDAIASAIERKLTAEQLSLQYDYILIKEQKEAERKRIEASGIRDFQQVACVGGHFGSYLNFYGIEATLELAKSNNSKMLLMGNRDNGLPLLFNLPVSEGPVTQVPPTPAPSQASAALPVVPAPVAPASSLGSANATSPEVLLSKETKELLDSRRLPESRLKSKEQDEKR